MGRTGKHSGSTTEKPRPSHFAQLESLPKSGDERHPFTCETVVRVHAGPSGPVVQWIGCALFLGGRTAKNQGLLIPELWVQIPPAFCKEPVTQLVEYETKMTTVFFVVPSMIGWFESRQHQPFSSVLDRPPLNRHDDSQSDVDLWRGRR